MFECDNKGKDIAGVIFVKRNSDFKKIIQHGYKQNF